MSNGRGITLRQPLATLAAHGLITLLPMGFGPSWVGHLALCSHLLEWDEDLLKVAGVPQALRKIGYHNREYMPRGAVVGIARLGRILVDGKPTGLALSAFDDAMIRRADGGILWEISHARTIEPIPHHQPSSGLWSVGPDLAAELNRALLGAQKSTAGRQ